MKKRVLVAMSGGVDSSVAAALLLEKGYDAVGVTMDPFFFSDVYDESKVDLNKNIEDAKKVCEKLGIEHLTVNFFETFKETVVDYFINEYLEGRTPNPCAICNPRIKWGKLLELADKLGFDYLATGHYARIALNELENRYYVVKGADANKDQSYFLWKLNQSQLSRTLFPLGEQDKERTRKMARELGLNISEKKESQEICFILDGDYRTFLRKKVPDLESRIGEGDIIFRGKKIGMHKGYPFYTIGQRRGLGVSHEKPLYVKKIDARNNALIVETADNLYSDEATLSDFNLQKSSSLDPNKIYTVKIRYRDPGGPARCFAQGDVIKIKFIEAKKALTPGQSAAIYDGDSLIGGGVIS